MVSKYSIQFVFFFICLGTLFLNASSFVNVQVTPKWYCAIFGGLIFVLLCLLCTISLCVAKAKQIFRDALPAFYLIIAVLCTLQALYGFLQHAGIFHTGSSFRVTGSFDNPAGFAACLCAGLPCALYFFYSKRSWVRHLACMAMAAIVFAVGFSASRAGFVSLAIVAIASLYGAYFFNAKPVKKVILLLLVSLSLSGLYFLKKDSADGRLLIWRCSWEMVKDKPVLGFGHGGFKANYMNYQAKYFEEHPDSSYAMLADNVNRPFNEYLLLLTNYGFAGLALFFAFAWLLWKSYRRCGSGNRVARTAGLCLLSIAGFAFFSYPLIYPFVWVAGILSIAAILYHAKYTVKIPLKIGRILALMGLPAAVISGLYACRQMRNEMNWSTVAHKSLAGQTVQMLPAYKRLHQAMASNELFLYNYAAELNVAQRYNESLQVAQECERLWADYDLQMLMADSYRQTERYEDAERRYRKAAAMCPVKFMPLYKLAKQHEELGSKAKAQELAGLILKKKVKVASPTIAAIRREMQRLVESKKGDAPAPEDRTDVKPVNKKHARQDSLSEQQAPKGLLPP
jgi:O-antigen ligase